MISQTHPIRIAVVGALVAVTGCFSLSREEPPMQHYVLGDAPQLQTQPLPDAGTGMTIGLRQLQLAAYLDSPFIVIRRGAHRITYSDFHRWGEPLPGGINRTIARHLLTQDGVGGVDVAPWSAGTRQDFVVEVHVTRFEGLAPDDPAATAGEVQMMATWQIRRPPAVEVLARGSTVYRHPDWRIGDYDALVGALERGIRTLAADVVTELRILHAPAAGQG